ncbi:MAG: thioredoxin domain-containing protein [Bacteroidetes bacterium]|nr:thioredoxin domain-containing protein [Bacteroidota bacterium]
METQIPPANHLIHETSPYLLQHAHNPVDWYPWCDAAWEKAKKENKLVLVSIGYSSCHWCHVMEHESFENDTTAQIMNELFVCIKVDREERPDIDQVYMTAVQLMTGSGGWPLNCFCLPDGRPIHGGTYFPNVTWNDLLLKLATFYKQNQHQAELYAAELLLGIHQSELVTLKTGSAEFMKDDAKKIVDNWRKYFDNSEGGPNRAPKFPLPNNYDFLLHYYYSSNDETILDHVKLTLDKMAHGGIYDHAGGGFSRYSTDSLWKVPHFEKMLYDNAQLVSLYSHAFQLTKSDLYKQVVTETLEFISREMTSAEGTFYSALDADSEGEEGKYYVWKKEELEKLPGENAKLFFDYFHVNQTGYWEHGNYILLRKNDEQEIAAKYHLSIQQMNSIISKTKKILLKEREKRVRPGLDDKQLTSWNALMIKACCDGYDAFGEQKFLSAAERCAGVILSKIKRSDGGLYHSYKNGKATINGYLEDYSFTIEAFIALYQSNFDERWLEEARQLADYTLKHFYDPDSRMFFFTSDLDPALIARKKEIMDNVIPSSNSSLAKGLFMLGIYFDKKEYTETSSSMLHNIKDDMARYGSSYSNWGILLLNQTFPFNEIVITGKNTEQKRMELNQQYLPNKILAGSINGNSKLGLLEQRFIEGKTLIYVCRNKTCQLPSENTNDAIRLMKQ